MAEAMTRTQTPLLIAAAHDPLRFAPSRQRPWDGVLARWRSLTLDAELAAGTAADTHRLRQVRARQLTSPHWRAKLATLWEDLLRRCAAGTAPSARAATIPVQQRHIVAAAPHIRRLTSALRAPAPVAVRGVAMASLLLTDGRGPVYNPAAANRLERLVLEALDGLEPTSALKLS